MEDTRIINYRWHDNRDTFCSRLAMRGENLKVIQQLAGHKTIQMSARYAHLGEKSRCEWLVARPDRRDWQMAGIEAVEVYWDAGQSLEPALMGTLHRQPSGKGEVLSFKYAGAWLDKTDGFTFDPNLTPDDRHQYPSTGSSNFGIFRDSSPDSWGQVLMQRWENLGARKEGVHSRRLMEWDFLLGARDEFVSAR